MLRVKSSALAPFVDQDRVRVGLDDVAHHVERAVEVHRRGFLASVSAIFGDVLVLALGDGVRPFGGRLGPVRRRCPRAGPDTHEPMSPTSGRVDAHVAVGFLRRDVDLDELLAAPVLVTLAAPGLALAVDSSQLRRAPMSITTSASGSTNERAAEADCSCVSGSRPFRHRHRQVGDAGALDQRADVGVGLRVGGALAQHDQRALRVLEQIERALRPRPARESGGAPGRRP